ncbi:phosphatase PAP2 family protein [Bacillus sp. JJ722]|uniref:phosphatase PAP2 family protein n=1 Tax=Bacillus sp. JJ722 TaxID=3122973 RepID=UPI00300040EB
MITLVIAGFMLYKKAVLHSLFVLFVTASGVGVNYVLKVLLQRERPEDTEYIDVFVYSFKLISYSFPSGHMMRITLIGAVVGLSRIVLGEHFPSDIIAAIFASIVWYCISLYLLFYIKSKWYFRIS